MSQIFISDLHLDAARPETTAAFLELLAGQCQGIEALYILGDLYEAWIGDDEDSELATRVRCVPVREDVLRSRSLRHGSRPVWARAKPVSAHSYCIAGRRTPIAVVVIV